MSYYLRVNFDDEFAELLMYLKSKYPEKLFNIDGIGADQTDLNQFSKDFFNTRGAAADSSIDPNSNVGALDVVTYTVEAAKPVYKLNSYYVLWKKLKQLYGKETAHRIVENQLTGSIYINDMVQLGAGISYCFNYSTNDVAQMGLPMIDKIKSVPPKYLYSFKSQLEQFVIIAANNTAGATGLADLFLAMSMYINKILSTGKDAHFYFEGWKDLNNPEIERTEPANKALFEKAVWDYVKENIVSFIYTINQPMRAGIQSPFTNVSVYDDTFLESMLPAYTLIDGDKIWNATKETAKKVQELFLDIMNEELERTVFTFPVTTACIALNENKEPSDPAFVEMIAKKNLKFGFINVYCGKTSTLSSCCFSGPEDIEVLDANSNELVHFTLKEFVEKNLPNGSIDAVAKKIVKRYFIMMPDIETGEAEYVAITGVLRKRNQFNKLIKISVKDSLIKVTPDHLVKVMDKVTESFKEIPASLLDSAKHLIPVYNSKTLGMAAFTAEEEYSTDFVYDIELESGHYFAANNIVTHNCRLRSESENRFFKEQTTFTLTCEDNSSVDVLSTDVVHVISIDGIEEDLYPDELKDKCNAYLLNGSQIISVEAKEEKIVNSERQYSNSFGAGSTKIGSIGVCTINLPRLAYKAAGNQEVFFENLKALAEDTCKVNNAKRNIIQKRIDTHSSPLYNYNFADLKKQYSTTGIVGLNECVEIMGMNILHEDGQAFACKILDLINANCEKYERLTKNPHNLEQIPAESAAVKLAKKDKLLKYQTPEFSYALYSNQFIPLVTTADLLDRVKLQGMFDCKMSGGSIAHFQLNQRIESAQQMVDFINFVAKSGTVYFAVNYSIKKCENGHVDVKTGSICDCGAQFTDEYCRVVGYLVNTKQYSKEKREDDYKKRQFYDGIKLAS